MSQINLTKKQKSVVDHQGGPLLVEAGPGSGKTRVLTERIRRILAEKTENFRILALTFTNKAANEMKQRLKDIEDISEKAFIGTLHSFCMEVLSQRGKAVGIEGMPQIFNSYQDRKEVLIQAIQDDPELLHELKIQGDKKRQNKKIGDWMRQIIIFKSRLMMSLDVDDELDRKAYEGYTAGLRASDAIDYDDLLLLTYRLFFERPKIASFYRRLYHHICIDEAQDLNFAQYGVIKSLCGDEFKNVVMVGDPKQSIYGFNTADPKLMNQFRMDFNAEFIELNENFRSSKQVVNAAKALDENYVAEGLLPINGEVGLITGKDEDDEASNVIKKIQELLKNGHPDVEGEITLERCVVLARTRYVLLTLEEELTIQKIPHYKQISPTYEIESLLMKQYMTSLRLLVNPKDRLHYDLLRRELKLNDNNIENSKAKSTDGIGIIKFLLTEADVKHKDSLIKALEVLDLKKGFLQLKDSFRILKEYANQCDEDERRGIWEDIKVISGEWDRYIRGNIGGRTDLAAFLTHLALGTMQQQFQEGLALLTVHSSKGLEFDIVFVIGMNEGTFPDYRVKTKKELAEEKRNAFVASSRSKRLLYFSYPKTRMMPWGSSKAQYPSRYLEDIGLIQN